MTIRRLIDVARLRLRSLVQREAVEQELDDELAFHVERQTEENVARGMSPSAARTAALRALGGIEVRKEQSRDARGTRWLEDAVRDAAYSLRTLRRTPSFTVVIVLTLALGIGATTAIFTLLDQVVLRDLPVRDPASLVIVQRMGRAPDGTISERNMPYPSFARLHDDTAVVRQMSAIAFWGVHAKIGQSAEPQRLQALLVSGDFFPMLGVGSEAGRLIDPADDSVGKAGVVVLDYDYWKSRLSGDERIVGSTIIASDAPFTVIGVAAKGFSGPSVGTRPELYFPITSAPIIGQSRSALSASNGFIAVLGRLQDGVTLAQASERLTPLYRRARIETAGGVVDSASLAPLRSTFIEVQPGGRGLAFTRLQFGTPLVILMAMVSLVLIIACGNIANLLVARAAVRRREVAVRLSIGAGRGRVVRQLLAESVVLALAGGALGLLVAQLGSHGLGRFLESGLGISLDVAPDVRVLAFVSAVSLATAVAFGLLPALFGTRMDLSAALRDGGRAQRVTRGTRRLSRVLVVAQVALSIVLLVGTGLFVRTLVALRNVDLGFVADDVVVVHIDPRRAGFSGARLAALYADLTDRARTVAGVADVAMADIGPLSGSSSSTHFAVEGRVPPTPADPPNSFYSRVSRGYFRTMRQPLLAGVDFDENARDRVIVNEAFARDLAGGSPLGKRAGFDLRPGATLSFEIVGVVKDSRLRQLRENVRPSLYAPFEGDTTMGSAFLVVRSAAPAVATIRSLRALILGIHPRIEIIRATTLEQRIEANMVREQLVAALATFFGALALLLAAIGLYGVVAQGVVSRTSEIGVRMALGATRARVSAAILTEAGRTLAWGLCIGLALTWGLTRLVAGLLYGIEPTDPPTIVACVVTLGLVTLAASWLPARRAARIDPARALRAD